MKTIRVHLENYFTKSEEEKESIQDNILNSIVLQITLRDIELNEVYEFLDNQITEAEQKEAYELAQFFLDIKHKIRDIYEDSNGH
jgi:hypothetical protein